MSEKKKASALFPLILIGAVVILVGAYAAFIAFAPKNPPAPADQATPPVASTEAPNGSASAPTEQPPSTMAENAVVVPTKVLTGPAPEPNIPVAKSDDPKVEQMMAVRKLGDDSAPIKVVEYSSLTCGHCAGFHKNDFPRLKTEYIDTGKVQFIFKEFPLNKPAIDASKLLRCLPVERFNSFMALLFDEQEKWAFKDDYLTPLKQNAKLAGLSDQEVDSCLNNKALEDRIVGDMKLGGDKYKIQATPSFVINDGLKTLVGHQPYGFFKETFDALLTGKTAVPQGLPAPAVAGPNGNQQFVPVAPNMAPQGMAPQAMPPQGVPPQGVPPQGMPPQGMQAPMPVAGQPGMVPPPVAGQPPATMAPAPAPAPVMAPAPAEPKPAEAAPVK